jgi:hypothetical protein
MVHLSLPESGPLPECSALYRVLSIGHSTKKSLPSVALDKVLLSVTTMFTESRTLSTEIHSKRNLYRVPNTRRMAVLGKGPSAAIYSRRPLSLLSAKLRALDKETDKGSRWWNLYRV